MMAEERSPTDEEVMAEVRAVGDRLRSLRAAVVKHHLLGICRLVADVQELDAARFCAVHEAARVFLVFLDEERKYVEASAADTENLSAQSRS
jgi:hypothetical protein